MTDAVKNSIIESITIPCRNRCEGHNKNINKNVPSNGGTQNKIIKESANGIEP